MIKAAKNYVRFIETVNIAIGNVIKFLVVVMIAVLTYEAVSRTFLNAPHKWALEMTQFINGTYYMLGGGYALLVGGHVRMDFFYEKWSPRKKAVFDLLTFVFTLSFLIILLIGGTRSSYTSLIYGQKNYSAWGPPVAPIKIISVIGIFLMLLQNIAEFIKDIAVAFGKDTTWIRGLENRQ